MASSNINVQNAALSSTNFPWKWALSDLERVPKNGHTVFSCFACGGAHLWDINSQVLRSSGTVRSILR